jgi:hypothetical protein
MTRTRRIGFYGLALGLLVVLPLGCGRPSSTPGKLSGNVSIDGAPVTGGDLYIHTAGGAIHAIITPTGSYTATDLPTGDWKVTVNTESLNPKRKKAPKVYGGKKDAIAPIPTGPQSTPSGAGGGVFVEIPTRYMDASSTPLTVTITAGSQTKNIELTKSK